MASNIFNLQDFVIALERWGLIDVLLPFLLIFILLFAVLQKTHILGDEKRNLNTVLALVISLIVVVPHVTGNYPAGYDPVDIMLGALPAISIIVVAIVMLLLMIGLFAHDKIYLGMTMPGWIAFFSIATLVVIFGSSAGWFASGFNVWLDDLFGSDALAVVIMVLVFGIIIAFVTGSGKEKEEYGAMKGLGFYADKLFGGKK